MSKYDFRGANIGNQTIVENQHGTLNLNSASVFPEENLKYLMSKLQLIQAEISQIEDLSPQVPALTKEVNTLLEESKDNTLTTGRVLDGLENVSKGLEKVTNLSDKARSVAQSVSETWGWVSSLLG